MKPQLIEMRQEYLINCDHCDFKIKNPTEIPNEGLEIYINMPCPECMENLLTEEDYQKSIKLVKTVQWVNKWFSWLLIFSSNRKKS